MPAGPPRAPLSRQAAVPTRPGAADLVGYLNYIPLPGADRRPPRVAYLTADTLETQDRRISRIVTLGRRHHRRRRPKPPPRLAAMCDRAEIPLFRYHVLRRPCDRRGARTFARQLFARRTTARRVHGHPRRRRAADGRIGPGQGETRPGTDLARPRPRGRRRGGLLPHLPDRHRRPLPPTLDEPAGGARHRSAGHPRHLWRDRRAPQMRLKLIVHLVRRETLERDFERLPYETALEGSCACRCARSSSRWTPARNLAVLVEAAVRNTILQLRGIDTYAEFVARHQRAIRANEARNSGSSAPAVGAVLLDAVGVKRQRVLLRLKPAHPPPRAGGAQSRVEELLHPAAAQADQMVMVMPLVRVRTPPLPDSSGCGTAARLLELRQRAVHRRQTDVGVLVEQAL